MSAANGPEPEEHSPATWRRFYAIVFGVLVAEVLLFAWLTEHFS
jgi:hypothetical protein